MAVQQGWSQQSAAVQHLMAKAMGRAVKTFSIGFDYEDFDERPYARQVAEAYGTDHEEMVVEADVLDLLPKHSEPRMDAIVWNSSWYMPNSPPGDENDWASGGGFGQHVTAASRVGAAATPKDIRPPRQG